MARNLYEKYKRQLTVREKRIMYRFSAMFVVSSIAAIGMFSLYNRKSMELEKALKDKSGVIKLVDSLYRKLDYNEYTIDSIEYSTEEKITKLSEDAYQYREVADDLFEISTTNARYEMALDYYADPLMHQEYRDRTGSSFKSKYTEARRKKIVEEIKKEAGSFNPLLNYMFAYDWYREIDPVAIREIEIFLFFTE